jgi:hypothetical protein
MAKLMWMTISFTFGIRRPANTFHLFGPWLRRFSKKQRNQVLIGVTVFCWALWLSRNEVVFQRSNFKSILQVMFRDTFWIRSWSILSKEEEWSILKEGNSQTSYPISELRKKKKAMVKLAIRLLISRGG